jgi:hypothetical protein
MRRSALRLAVISAGIVAPRRLETADTKPETVWQEVTAATGVDPRQWSGMTDAHVNKCLIALPPVLDRLTAQLVAARRETEAMKVAARGVRKHRKSLEDKLKAHRDLNGANASIDAEVIRHWARGFIVGTRYGDVSPRQDGPPRLAAGSPPRVPPSRTAAVLPADQHVASDDTAAVRAAEGPQPAADDVMTAMGLDRRWPSTPP